jgi:HEAT repeat protein
VPGSNPKDPQAPLWPADPVERAAAAAAAGLMRQVPVGTQEALDRLVRDDPDPRVRTAALGALSRLPDLPPGAWSGAADDPDPTVRRRAADLAPVFAGSAREIPAGVVALLDDREVSVVEAAAWALGELGPAAIEAGAVAQLAEAAGSHSDPLVREAAVAALGALGHQDGLEAVLAACRDKPAIRRRAVLALAAFEGPAVDEALRAALEDKDWQTRQAAEDLLA